MSDERYEILRGYLDEISAMGMPKTESGVEIRMLKKLFTPEEADAVVYLKPFPESIEVIAERMGKSPEEVEPLLKKMVENCIIQAVPTENGVHYKAIPWAPGIIELSITNKNADEEYARDYMEYLDTEFGANLVKEGRFPFTRTIPVSESIIVDQMIPTHQQIAEIIEKAARPRAVQECWCRAIKERSGHHCEKDITRWVCLAFGSFAEHIIESGRGREIDDAEFREIARQISEAGLIPHVTLNTSSFTEIMTMCNCCTCCCGMLYNMVKRHPDEFKGGQATSSYISSIDEDECTGCELCVDRCPTDALSMNENEIAELERPGRCLGCGLCTTDCPTNAITLTRRSEEEIPEVPGSISEFFDKLGNPKMQKLIEEARKKHD